VAEFINGFAELLLGTPKGFAFGLAAGAPKEGLGFPNTDKELFPFPTPPIFTPTPILPPPPPPKNGLPAVPPAEKDPDDPLGAKGLLAGAPYKEAPPTGGVPYPVGAPNGELFENPAFALVPPLEPYMFGVAYALRPVGVPEPEE